MMRRACLCLDLRPQALALLPVLFLAGAACVGNIGDGEPGGPGPGGMPSNSSNPPTNTPGRPGEKPGENPMGGPGDQPNTPGAGADPNAAGPMPLRRLTRREYNNTVRDLLGDTSRPADSFPPDKDSAFTFRRAGLVATVDASRLSNAAEALATAAEAKLDTLVPCKPAVASEDEACARKFIEGFGLRAYRRPLLADEIERHLKLYRDGRGSVQLDFKGGIRLLIEAMLQSPNFVYRWELGAGTGQREGALIRLGPYEMASRLSYAIWGSMPDQALFDAAASGKLGTVAEVEAQTRRLLNDERARDTMIAFFDEWFGFEDLAERPKDPKVYPEWKDDLKQAMAAELRAFISHVVFEGDGKLSTIMQAPFSFVNQPLAALYGLSGVSGTALKRTDLDGQQRAGLLTLSGWLALTGASDGSHPVMRGKMIYERLLCGHLPPPPPDVPPPQLPREGLTTRERFAEHGSQACAVGCHAIMDPLGFAFENYDGVGKFRQTEAGKPVDASGSVTLDKQTRSFNNARELTKLLAESPEAQRCFATQMSRFVWNRGDTDQDRASIDSTLATSAKGGHALKEMLVGITTARSFRYRLPAADEVMQ
jgi:hypothetical protein